MTLYVLVAVYPAKVVQRAFYVLQTATPQKLPQDLPQVLTNLPQSFHRYCLRMESTQTLLLNTNTFLQLHNQQPLQSGATANFISTLPFCKMRDVPQPAVLLISLLRDAYMPLGGRSVLRQQSQKRSPGTHKNINCPSLCQLSVPHFAANCTPFCNLVGLSLLKSPSRHKKTNLVVVTGGSSFVCPMEKGKMIQLPSGQ